MDFERSVAQGKSSDESWAKSLEDKIDRYTILSQLCLAMAENRRELKDKEKSAKAFYNAAIYHEAIIAEKRKAGKNYPAEKEIDDIVTPTLYYIDGNDLARAQEFLTYIKAVNPKHDSISTIEQKLAKAKNSSQE
jgi:hypothetical protein